MKSFNSKLFQLITAALLLSFITNLIIAVAIDFRFNFLKLKGDPRWMHKVYQTSNWSKTHFRELGETTLNYAPGFGWKRSKYAGKTINIAEDGVRVSPYSQDEGEAIVFLGGSTMWGTGVDDLNTIPSLFNKISGYKHKVINGGETDYSVWNSYQFLIHLLNSGLDIQYVISMDGVNQYGSYRKQIKNSKFNKAFEINYVLHNTQLVNSFNNHKNNQGTLNWIQNFFKPSLLFLDKIVRPTFVRVDDTYEKSEHRHIHAAEELVEGWVAIKTLCDRNGIKFRAILQPLINFENFNNTEIAEQIKTYQPLYSGLYKETKSLLKTKKYITLDEKFLDLSELLLDKDDVFIDLVHVGPEGNQIIASAIYSSLEEK